MRDMDVNGDGVLQFSEFIELMRALGERLEVSASWGGEYTSPCSETSRYILMAGRGYTSVASNDYLIARCQLYAELLKADHGVRKFLLVGFFISCAWMNLRVPNAHLV